MEKIIICPNEYKEKQLALSHTNKKLNTNFYITLEDLKSRIYFDYNSNAIMKVRDYLNVKYSVATTILKEIYFIDDETDNKNLKQLINIKNMLIKENLLVFDDLFKLFLKRHDCDVCGYLLTKEDKLVINEVKKITNVKIFEPTYSKHEIQVYKYHTIENEVEGIFARILNLVNNDKVLFSQIKLTNVNSDYIHLIKRYSKFANLKVNFKRETNILSSTIVNKFLDMYKENKNLEEIIENLKLAHKNNEILKKIIKLINTLDTSKDLTDVFLHEFENIKFDEAYFENAIEVVDFYNYDFSEDDYVFLLGFNSKAMPREFKNDSYLNDDIRSKLNLDTNIDKIKHEKEVVTFKLYSIKNLFLSYKEKTKNSEFLPSVFVSTLDMKVVEDSSTLNTKLNRKVNAALDLDTLIQYQIKSDTLNKFFYLIEKEYRSYSNKYTKVDSKVVREMMEDNILLSYTTLSIFYKCRFSYYLDRILKIKVESDMFTATVGNIFHEILERLDEINVEDFLKENEEKFLSATEKFYYEKLSLEFIDTLKILKEMKEYTSLSDQYNELEVNVDSKGLFNRRFVAKVDKVIYKKNKANDYIAVIDYKTGSIKASLENVDIGFNLQLPIYAYLLKNSNHFNNPIVLGIFLQKLVNKIPKYDNKTTYQEKLYENLKLKGYVSNISDIEILDKTYQNSKLIDKLKTNKDGITLSSYSKKLSDEQFDSLAKTVEELIEKAFDDIEKMNFTIDPKIIKKQNESCKFCKFDSICFKTYKDEIVIEKEEEEDVD